ncbi:MAG TPA: hypothetical protein PKV66_00380 [Candidatus Pelethenecus sp.]|nr:hypothetical protein [Candidatus Pelethenecus sp.]
MEIKERYTAGDETTTLWDDYQNGLSYQASCGLSKKLPEFVRFYEGQQWATPTKNTKNLPRPVINIVKMICRNKKSAITSVPVKIIYEAEDSRIDVKKFNNFADYIQKEIGQEGLDKNAIDDGVKKGSYFYHYYWDSEAKGKDGIKEGGLRCEIIDPLNIFFSNPTELDEQKQKWILIATREDVDSIKAKCDDGVDLDLIISDEADNKYGVVEQEGNKLCTVLTRYFRKDGEVYCEKATKSVIINKPFALAPDIEAAKRELGFEEDAPNNSLPDNHDNNNNLSPKGVRAYLYPVVVGNYDKRENSIYGLGEVEGIIPNQKAINFNLAMSLLNAQEIAWGKYIVMPNALRGQVINNEPGQVLTDYSGTGNGIRKMSEQVIQTQPLQLLDSIMQMTRNVTGANEVMSGEVLGANMSGAAIAQLQSQAQQPIEDLKTAFWLVKEKQGKVLAQFFKLYYADKEFSYKENVQKRDEQGNPILNEFGVPQEDEMQMKDTFNSSEFADTDFSIVVETMSGTKSSTAGDINALDVLMSKGLISLKTYISAYPKDALSNKTDILKGIEEDEKNQVAQLTKQAQAMAEQLKESMEVIQRQKDTVDKVVSVIQENNQLKSFIAQLYTEAKSKILEGNQEIEKGNAKIREVTDDATNFAQVIAQGGLKDVMS